MRRAQASVPAKMSLWLLLGDALVLALFSAGGLAFHSVSGAAFVELTRIGAPFALGYFLVAHLLQATRWDAAPARFMGRSAAAWLLGIGLGILLRIVVEGRVPIASFLAVTYAFTGALLLGWRAVYWTAARRLSKEQATASCP